MDKKYKICVDISDDMATLLKPLLELVLNKFGSKVEVEYSKYSLDKNFDFGIVYKLTEGKPACPYIEIMDKETYNGNLVKNRYIHQYPVKAFFVKEQLLRDPDELAGLVGIVKDEIRRIIVSQEGEKSLVNIKEIGWKAAGGAKGAASQFMTILWDQKMQDFLAELSFYLNRQNYKKLKGAKITDDNVVSLFQDIGDKLIKKDSKVPLTGIKKNEVFKKLTGEFAAGDEFKTQHIIIEGESGSGKSMLAELVHEMVKAIAEDTNIPFQIVSAANLSQELIQHELFGSVRGAFTDAAAFPGRCTLARGGILFIDELGCLPPDAQARLLVYLDKFQFMPMGWPFAERIVSPAFVIAATNAKLPKMIADGNFREDLYHRFRIKMRIPPLRERTRNFRLLVDIVLQNSIVNPEDKKIKKITITALRKLEKHDFPGNFRELEAVLSRAVLRAQLDGSEMILAEHIAF